MNILKIISKAKNNNSIGPDIISVKSCLSILIISLLKLKTSPDFNNYLQLNEYYLKMICIDK